MGTLETLLDGNKVFIKGKITGKDALSARERTREKQTPYATVLTCSDSRVVPEHIFNTNLGEIFVIRTAGNVVDEVSIGSIEYAVAHLHTPLLVVMGHEKCGAVTAACQKAREHGSIPKILEKIEGKEDVEGAIKANAKKVVEELRKRSAIIKSAEQNGKLRIVAMEYYISNGKAELLSG